MGMTTERTIEIYNDYDRISGIINSWELGLIDNIGHEIEEVLEDGNDD